MDKETPLTVDQIVYRGALVDRYDERDHQYSEIAAGIAPFDWSKGYDVEQELRAKINDPNFKIPIKNQDGSGSCGGQAFAYQAEILEALQNGVFSEKSAKFIYSQTYVPVPGGGSYFRDNCNVFIKQGDSDENILPSYENGNPPGEAFMERSQDITQAARDNAAFTEALSYAEVAKDIDSVAQAVQANHGAIIIIRGDNNGTWRGNSPVPPSGMNPYWQHFLYVGKAMLNNGKKALKVLNSWGNVGDSGWQWLGEEWFTAGNILQCRTHVINQDALGWVASRYVSAGRTIVSNLRLREKPTLSGRILKTLPRYTKLQVFGAITPIPDDGETWVKVQVK